MQLFIEELNADLLQVQADRLELERDFSQWLSVIEQDPFDMLDMLENEVFNAIKEDVYEN
jgi:SAM-dependent MidA family methyltransferase